MKKEVVIGTYTEEDTNAPASAIYKRRFLAWKLVLPPGSYKLNRTLQPAGHAYFYTIDMYPSGVPFGSGGPTGYTYTGLGEDSFEVTEEKPDFYLFYRDNTGTTPEATSGFYVQLIEVTWPCVVVKFNGVLNDDSLPRLNTGNNN